MHKFWNSGVGLGGAVTSLVIIAGISVATAAPMKTGRITSQPIGHYEFCLQVLRRMPGGPARGAGPAYEGRLVNDDQDQFAYQHDDRSAHRLRDVGKEEIWS
jgi:predicted transglutaminase-like cysteine proteinase